MWDRIVQFFSALWRQFPGICAAVLLVPTIYLGGGVGSLLSFLFLFCILAGIAAAFVLQWLLDVFGFDNPETSALFLVVAAAIAGFSIYKAWLDVR